LTAHGTDPDSIDEQTFTDICIMFHDGIIGNLGIIEVLGVLTAGHFNMTLPKDKIPFKLQDIIPQAYNYLYPPLTKKQEQEQVSKNLLAFAMMQPGAPDELFKGN
jgi:hypothetical protein